MKFIDKANFSAKISNISKKQGLTLRSFLETGEGHELLVLVPTFIDTFFQLMRDDSNSKEAFHSLSIASEEKLESIERVLSFYFFYILDRFYGHSLLNDEDKVLFPLRAIWGWSHSGLPRYIELFNAQSEEDIVANYPVKILSDMIGQELNTIFIKQHLHNAFKLVIKNQS